ncbi:hypothetical protein SAY86_005218 [Trapa natans]|uniref:Uncharacterized protein n=1 Tax=Trapa natans TaxID=22666 RepID=A0AAN7L7I8_TRANT|nr:hypothetical protein SAY86_005218 [Trapa natans]
MAGNEDGINNFSGLPHQSSSLLHSKAMGFSDMAMMGSSAGSLFGSSAMENYGSMLPNSAGLSLSVFPPTELKEGDGNSMGGGGGSSSSAPLGLMGGGSRTLYNADANIGNHHVSRIQPNPPPAPMSATALLQKTAQMGSTRSSGNPGSMFVSGFGLVSSSSSSSSSLKSRSSSDPEQLRVSAATRKHAHGDHNQQQQFGVSALMDLNLTRDFLP